MSPAVFALVASQVIASSAPKSMRHDTLSISADTASVVADTTPAAQLSFDFGRGVGEPIAARSFDFEVSSARTATVKTPMTITTSARFSGALDSLGPEFARRVASGERIPAVHARLQRRGDAPAVLLHLYDVQVISSRLVMANDDMALLQQRLGLESSIAQISGDLQEAQLQLNVTESLDKRKLSSSLELGRARAARDMLAKRLAVQQRMVTLLERQIARYGPISEEVVLAAGRMEIDTR